MNPRPKRKRVRNRKLLDLAHEVYDCQFQTEYCIRHQQYGCVPAHSNHSEHGKGMGQKADDDQHVASCNECHLAYDGGLLGADSKRLFDEGRARTFALYQTNGWYSEVKDEVND